MAGVTGLRLLDGIGRDLVYRYRLLPTPGFDYVGRACIAMTGYTPEEHYADPELGMRLVHPDDLPLLDAMRRGSVPPGPLVIRWVRRDGSILWTEQRAQVVLDAQQRPAWIEGIARDITDLVIATDAMRAAHAGVRSLLEISDDLGIIVEPSGRVVYANPALLALTGWSADEVQGRAWAGLFGGTRDQLPGALRPDRASPPQGREPAPILLRDGTEHLVRWRPMPLLDSRAAVVATAALGSDQTRSGRADEWAVDLGAAVAMSGESVVITDPEARIQYVNRAFERATGYRSDEVLGRNPRILASGHQSPAFYRSMWWILGRGRTWRGELVNRRRDGTLLVEEATIAPVTGADGGVVAYVAVKRDVTRTRHLRASLDDATRQREVLAKALDGLAIRETAEATCEDLAAVMCELPASVAAGVALIDGESAAQLIAVRSLMPLQIASGFALPDIAERMLKHAEQGPWIEPVMADGSPEATDALEAGIHAILIVPLRHEATVLGALLLAGADATGADLQPQIAAATQIATVARTLLAPHVASRNARALLRERVRSTIEDQAFRIVFQPIVDLYSGGVVGFEALARFDDLRNPLEHFAEATACEMGEALELAAIEAAIAAAEPLSRGAMLTLNVSPSTIGSPRLGDLLRESVRPIVLEITEHARVDDYEALRASIASLGPAVRVAVDDAGAGEANLHHLIQLRPDFVKLDISLVRGIDADFTRQAMVVGLKEFARVSGRALIAEGIETDLERTTLSELSVRFGQGYLLGAPAPAAAWANVVIESQESFAADSASAAWEPRQAAPAPVRPLTNRRRRPEGRPTGPVPAGPAVDPAPGSGGAVGQARATVGWRRP